jgi:HEAT repeat protein
MARYALEPNPSPKVNTVLRDALKKVDGDLLIGVIGSIGVRKDKEAVDEVSAYLKNPNQGVVQAAARSLGSIGSVQAAKAIAKALPKADNPQVKQAMIEGLLRCADTMEAQDQKNQARKIFKQIQKSSPPDYIQSAVKSRM